MPLTSKGRKLESALEEEYGEKKGKEVLYAGRNSGKFTGIDQRESKRQTKAMLDGKRVSGRERAKVKR